MHSISPCSYKFIRDSKLFILPHPSTIRRVCSNFDLGPQKEQCEKKFLSYVKGKFQYLQPRECFVNLQVDEIKLKEYFDYKSGNVVGSDNEARAIANSAQVFLTSSLLSNYTDVVHVQGVRNITGESLHQWFKKVITGLEEIGFKFVAVITDNNAINRKGMSFFSDPPAVKYVYEHPKDKERPLFFIIDTVHIMKSIWHNWMKQKNDSSMIYPAFEEKDETGEEEDEEYSKLQYASFNTLIELHQLEHHKLAKHSYGLTLKALYPNSFEKQNVKLPLQIFNENTIESLRTLGPKHSLMHCEETTNYIKIIVDWWKIVNIKTPGTGNRLNDQFMHPIRTTDPSNSIQISYLNKMLNWLYRWKELNIKSLNGFLSRETHFALIQSTMALINVSDYCLKELNFKYVLLGKFQTDLLENRFGKYRQLSGGMYNISIRQLYEVEQKLILQSFIRLNLKSTVYGEISLSDLKNIFSECPEKDNEIPLEFSNIEVYSLDVENANEDLPVLAYIAGYCCYSILKKIKCEFCKNILIQNEVLLDELVGDKEQSEKTLQNEELSVYSWTGNLSRGKLLFPENYVINVVIVVYCVIKELCDKAEADFLKVPNQRELVTSLSLKSILANEFLWDGECCPNKHYTQDICKKIVWICTNVFLNNYCKRKNESLIEDSVPRKKKIFTHGTSSTT